MGDQGISTVILIISRIPCYVALVVLIFQVNTSTFTTIFFHVRGKLFV